MDIVSTGHLPWAQQGTVGTEPGAYKNVLILVSFKSRRKKILNISIIMLLNMNNSGHNNNCIITNLA